MNGKTIVALIAFLCCSPIGQVFSQTSATAISIKGDYITTRSGLRIHYLESGRNTSSPALILIPGWRLPAFLWKEQLLKFSHSTRVIAIDPRSQGDSTITNDGNTPESRANDLQEILAGLKVSRFVLVGWSQGAQDVAAYLQAFGTGSVAGVVLVDSPVSYGPAELELHPQFSKAVLNNVSVYANHPQEFSEGMVRSLFKQQHSDPDLAAVVQSTLKTPTSAGIAMLIADIFGTDRRPALAKLDRPAFVIAAASSPLLDSQNEMAASIPGSKFVAIEGAAHAVFVDQPEAFDSALQAFLQSLH